MIDSVAKIVGNVLNTWYAPRLIEKAIADLTVLELTTISIQLSKYQLKLDSVILIGTVEAMFISPIPILSVGIIAHIGATYLIWMGLPRQIIFA
jgi:hypothetical protein